MVLSHMRISWLFGGVIAVAAVVAASRSPAPIAPVAELTLPATAAPGAIAAAAAESTSEAAPEPAANVVRGEVLETHAASSYTYLRLHTATGEAWAAIPAADIQLHSQVAVVGATKMQSFKSKTLNRTFDLIYFGTLEGSTDAEPSTALPPGHPNIGAASPAADGAPAAAPALPPGHPDIGNASTACAKTGSCSKLPLGHGAPGGSTVQGDWRDIPSEDLPDGHPVVE
ncbi:MAG: hypothetical protein ABIQ16_13750 [Polyangiaceae bacterium]